MSAPRQMNVPMEEVVHYSYKRNTDLAVSKEIAQALEQTKSRFTFESQFHGGFSSLVSRTSPEKAYNFMVYYHFTSLEEAQKFLKFLKKEFAIQEFIKTKQITALYKERVRVYVKASHSTVYLVRLTLDQHDALVRHYLPGTDSRAIFTKKEIVESKPSAVTQESVETKPTKEPVKNKTELSPLAQYEFIYESNKNLKQLAEISHICRYAFEVVCVSNPYTRRNPSKLRDMYAQLISGDYSCLTRFLSEYNWDSPYDDINYSYDTFEKTLLRTSNPRRSLKTERTDFCDKLVSLLSSVTDSEKKNDISILDNGEYEVVESEVDPIYKKFLNRQYLYFKSFCEKSADENKPEIKEGRNDKYLSELTTVTIPSLSKLESQLKNYEPLFSGNNVSLFNNIKRHCVSGESNDKIAKEIALCFVGRYLFDWNNQFYWYVQNILETINQVKIECEKYIADKLSHQGDKKSAEKKSDFFNEFDFLYEDFDIATQRKMLEEIEKENARKKASAGAAGEKKADLAPAPKKADSSPGASSLGLQFFDGTPVDKTKQADVTEINFGAPAKKA